MLFKVSEIRVLRVFLWFRVFVMPKFVFPVAKDNAGRLDRQTVRRK